MARNPYYDTLTTFDKCKMILSCGFDIDRASDAEVERNYREINYYKPGNYYVCRGFIFDFIFGKSLTVEIFIDSICETALNRRLKIHREVTDEEVNKVLNIN